MQIYQYDKIASVTALKNCTKHIILDAINAVSTIIRTTFSGVFF